MAEQDRLDPDKLWLWLDFETSDLNVDSLSVIEAACTVTNSSLVQQAPIRSYLCAFSPPGIKVVTPDDFHAWNAVNPDVQEMHKQSGLSNAHVYAHPYGVVRSVEAFDRLVLDYLLAVGWDGHSRVVLAGSGVAAFDSRVLKSCGSVLALVCHYRCADVSVAAEVLGVPVPKSMDAVSALLREAPPVVGGVHWEDRGVEEWIGVEDLETQVLHRAGVDVAVSVLLGRSLRARSARRV